MSEFYTPEVLDNDNEVRDRWANLESFLEGTPLSDVEREIVANADDPQTAWELLDLYWSTGDYELDFESN